MINGGHVILYTTDAEADRAFLRDVLDFPHVDVGEGWLIFALPPSEVAVHPATQNSQEFYLMCDDIEGLVTNLRSLGMECSAIADRGWGLLSELRLPSGARLGVYEPRHARPSWESSRSTARKTKSSRASQERKRKSVTTRRARAKSRQK